METVKKQRPYARPVAPPPPARPQCELVAEVPFSVSWGQCEYCQRQDDPHENGSCKGCGARRRKGKFVDVTAFGDRKRRFLFVEGK